MNEKIYSIENNLIIEHDLDVVRRNLNDLNGCPMWSGARPRYELFEITVYRVMRAAECGYPQDEYSRFDEPSKAEADLEHLQEEYPEDKAWIDAILVHGVGSNKHGKFHEIDRFDTEELAIEKLNACLDELISEDPERMWYWRGEEAEEALTEL